MKYCPKCNLKLPLVRFGKNSRRYDGLQAYCRMCRNKYVRDRYAADPKKQRSRVERNDKRYREIVRTFIRNYKLDHPCVDCGETNPIVLEFDHVRGTKSFNIGSSIALKLSIQKVQSEISKCEVRCANCHKIVTYNRSHSAVPGGPGGS